MNATQSHHLPEVLLAYLDTARASVWPGSDGLTLDDALTCYSAAVAAKQVPDRSQLRERYPDLADEVEQFFTRAGA